MFFACYSVLIMMNWIQKILQKVNLKATYEWLVMIVNKIEALYFNNMQ